MFYPRDQFFRLMAAVEDAGGEHLDAVHEHSIYTHFTGGEIKDPKQGYVKNCGQSALFELPYESFLNNDTVSAVTVCALDDGVGLWPRFAHANAPGDWSG